MAFSPVSLFAGGEQGVIYDVQDLASLWQDSAATIPAALDGPVGRIDDRSGNGNHATQDTAAKRPTLRFFNGAYYLDFDGVDDFLRATFSITQPITRVMLMDMRTWVDGQHMVTGATSFASGLVKQAGSAPALRLYSGTNFQAQDAGDYRLAEQVAGLTYEVHNGADSYFAVGQDTPVQGDAGTQDPGGITLGATWLDASTQGGLRIYGLVEIDRLLTATELEQVRGWLTQAWARVLIVDGDSNSQAPLLTARSYAYQFLPHANPPVFLQNIAIGGTGLDTNVPNDLATPSRVATISARFPSDFHDQQYLYFPWWSNNLEALPAVSEPLGPGAQTPESYAARIAIFLAMIKAASGGRALVGIGTILERTDMGQDNTAIRGAYNALIAAPGWITANNIDFLVDFAADPVIGAVGASLDPLLFIDGVHLTELGESIAETVFREVINNIPLVPDVVPVVTSTEGGGYPITHPPRSSRGLLTRDYRERELPKRITRINATATADGVVAYARVGQLRARGTITKPVEAQIFTQDATARAETVRATARLGRTDRVDAIASSSTRRTMTADEAFLLGFAAGQGDGE